MPAKVLVVEDEYLIRMLLEDMLDELGYGVAAAVGSLAEERRISLQEAAAVRLMLAQDRIDTAKISVAGRGKFDPLVPTADRVPEPRNNRIEVWVR